MSLKNIELQVALPRTLEAVKVQEQMLHKSMLDQEAISLMNQAQQELDRSRSTAVIESTASHSIHQDGNNDQRMKNNKQKKDKKKTEIHEAAHPYKGKHIDITL